MHNIQWWIYKIFLKYSTWICMWQCKTWAQDKRLLTSQNFLFIVLIYTLDTSRGTFVSLLLHFFRLKIETHKPFWNTTGRTTAVHRGTLRTHLQNKNTILHMAETCQKNDVQNVSEESLTFTFSNTQNPLTACWTSVDTQRED